MLRNLGKDEEARLTSLDALEALGGLHDDAFHHILDMTCILLNLPGCFIYLFGSQRIWIKAKKNLAPAAINHDSPLFNFVRYSGDTLICEDTHQDPRFASDPMVTGPSAIRQFIATPLRTSEGYVVGAVCVIDRKPGSFSAPKADLLNNMAMIVTELLEAQSEIGLVDAVTRFPNRQRLLGDIQQLAPEHGEFVLILIDTLDIKYVYEIARSFGMAEVESVLRDIGHFLKTTFMNEQMIYAISLGRFAIILRAEKLNRYMEHMENFADRMQREVRSIVPLKLDFYAGYVWFSPPCSNPPELLRMATSALHDAIDERVTISAYSESKDATRKFNLNILNDLAESLNQQRGLYLVFQPKVILSTRKIIGAEALLRWQHPTLGEIQPDAFIPIAESTSLIKLLTEFVIARSVLEAKRLREQGINIPISINISANNFAEPDFAEKLDSLVRDGGLQPQDIEIECLETQRILESTEALACVKNLRQMGYAIALDDFGTGYSNLNYLRNIPADLIKIDRSLIENLKSDNDSRIIVEILIKMLHMLNYVVLAEGVEDRETLKYLEQYQCDIIQGYFYSPPMMLERLMSLIAAEQNGMLASYPDGD
ncbi:MULTISPECIES: sensor domain-containing phosphodiesterase [unclassified Serratia (in: enterobacteria)]|uniref:sensor domain-containing phosphodiesterase n=1 Tax=unclassified Serratia (in: enterobacteria) TaxID=2647522 RepID=UPI003076717A